MRFRYPDRKNRPKNVVLMLNAVSSAPISDCGYAQLAACSGNTIIGEAAAMTGYRRKSC